MVLLPTRSSTASIFFASAIRLERSGPSISTRSTPSFSSMANRSRLRVVAMTFAPALTASFTAAWPKDEVAPRITRVWPLRDLQVAEQAGPRGRIGLGKRGELGPGQVGLDQGDVRRGRAGVFGVAPVDGPAEAAHQRGHLRPDRKLAARAGLHDADALDAADLGGLGPLAPTHVHLGVVDAERLDLDDDMAGLRLRLGDVLVNEAVEPAELLDDDGTHLGPPIAVAETRRVALRGMAARP